MLQEIQAIYSYLPEEALARLSREAKIPMSRIYAVATFYSQFFLAPRGKNIVRVCQGTACHIKGGTSILEEVEGKLGIKAGNTTDDHKFSLERVACVGCCALAPVVVVNNQVHAKMTPSEAKELIADY
jgi:NADH-quinone oxidoreductase subunit E